MLGESKDFLIEYAVIDPKSKEIVANLRGVKRLKTNAVIPLLYAFNLGELPSGEYLISLTAKNRKNEPIAQKQLEFYRINPLLVNYSAVNAKNTFVDSITNIEELKAYVKSLRPISTHDELTFAENQLEYGDLRFMQQYFLNFWKTRDQVNPEQKWLEYKEKVILVDKEFGYGGVKGYTTERGRVYLQYGPPSAVQDVPYDRDTYPYSIWQYYKLQGLTDRKIVFYSPSMEMLGYQILHSNVRGEVYNPNWELDLISKSNGNKSTQEVPEGSIINENANTLFNNPR
jgi:GWxTD domain-containing protein